jgi:hypothetical protein
MNLTDRHSRGLRLALLLSRVELPPRNGAERENIELRVTGSAAATAHVATTAPTEMTRARISAP